MQLSFGSLVLTFLVASVSAIPAAAPAASSKSSSKPASASPTSTAGAGATGTECSPEVMALASGISANIDDQRNEQAAVTAVGDTLNENPMDPVAFAAAKASLLDFVNKGITIRENNQKIAPAGNPAIPGLATVAMAQVEEFNLTNSLTGVAATDNKTVATLKTDFAGGIMQNMKNLAAVRFIPVIFRKCIMLTNTLNTGHWKLHCSSRGCK